MGSQVAVERSGSGARSANQKKIRERIPVQALIPKWDQMVHAIKAV
jgi:hypothetical protein